MTSRRCLVLPQLGARPEPAATRPGSGPGPGGNRARPHRGHAGETAAADGIAQRAATKITKESAPWRRPAGAWWSGDLFPAGPELVRPARRTGLDLPARPGPGPVLSSDAARLRADPA